MTTHLRIRVTCDRCGFMSDAFDPKPWALGKYLREGSDGKWLVLGGSAAETRHICRGCIIDRACRIFGHRVQIMPHPFEGQLACTRCQTFQAVS